MKTLEQKIRARAAVCGDWRLESELLALAAEADALEARAAAAEQFVVSWKEQATMARASLVDALEQKDAAEQHAAALADRQAGDAELVRRIEEVAPKEWSPSASRLPLVAWELLRNLRARLTDGAAAEGKP
jgi:hypothetical protein